MFDLINYNYIHQSFLKPDKKLFYLYIISFSFIYIYILFIYYIFLGIVMKIEHIWNGIPLHRSDKERFSTIRSLSPT